jgi:predicted short-subunit dehydrogenase-like oxidoreductase (DUF2520 family)
MTLLDRQSKIGFIGAGRIAGHLAASFIENGYTVAAISSKNDVSAKALARELPSITPQTSNQNVVNECDVIFVTVPDDAIASTVTALSWSKEHGVVHCSGARTLECLEGAASQGAMVASFHPLQTFPSSIEPVMRLEGVGFAMTGDPRLVNWLQGIVASVGGIKLSISDDVRSLYHASAVMVCGYMITLLQHSLKLWEQLGVATEDALRALIPLMRTTIDNVEKHGVQRAVTGPIARGDISTVEGHLESLQAIDGDLLEFYAFLGKHTVRCNDIDVEVSGELKQRVADLLCAHLKSTGQSIQV